MTNNNRAIQTPVSVYAAIRQDVADLKDLVVDLKAESDYNRQCIITLMKALAPIFPTIDTFDNGHFRGIRKEIIAGKIIVLNH